MVSCNVNYTISSGVHSFFFQREGFNISIETYYSSDFSKGGSKNLTHSP